MRRYHRLLTTQELRLRTWQDGWNCRCRRSRSLRCPFRQGTRSRQGRWYFEKSGQARRRAEARCGSVHLDRRGQGVGEAQCAVARFDRVHGFVGEDAFERLSLVVEDEGNVYSGWVCYPFAL
jgi:hypothetical protein